MKAPFKWWYMAIEWYNENFCHIETLFLRWRNNDLEGKITCMKLISPILWNRSTPRSYNFRGKIL